MATRPKKPAESAGESAKPMHPPAQPRIETRPIASLKVAPYNPRRISEAALRGLQSSVERFGLVQPIIVNERTGYIVGGHQRMKALKATGATEVLVVLVDLPDIEERALNLALNSPAISGEFTEGLGALLDEVQAADADLFDALMLGDLEVDAQPVPVVDIVQDEAPEPPPEPKTRTGDLWLLGAHRLLCGDSTSSDDVERLMAGGRVPLCFTSPPYGQQRDYTKEGKEKCMDWDVLMRGVFANIPTTEDGQVLVNLGMIHRDGEWIPYWDEWIEWMRDHGWRRFGWYVWDQGSGLPGDWNGRLGPSHEFVFHFNRVGIRPEKWVEKNANSKPTGTNLRGKDGKNKPASSVCDDAGKVPDSVIRVNRNSAHGTGHPATFPVPLPAFAMQSWPGAVYEPFCGSGTTLIAAEQLGRRCYGMEISPEYCDVIVKRWETLTGRSAVLEASADAPPGQGGEGDQRSTTGLQGD